MADGKIFITDIRTAIADAWEWEKVNPWSP
jgi:hypothetical protein